MLQKKAMLSLSLHYAKHVHTALLQMYRKIIPLELLVQTEHSSSTSEYT